MRKEICLNGYWDFSCETDSLEKVPSNWEVTQILVPSPFNVNRFAGGYPKHSADERFYVSGGDFRLFPEYPMHWDDAKRGFYKRNLFIPAESKGKRLFLRFQAVACHSVFYLNGKKLHEDMEAFLPIEIEITDHVEYGKDNELIVGAELSSELKYRDENNRHRLDYPVGSFWGDQVAGIWQDVWLYERPMEYVNDIFAISDVYKRTLDIRYEYTGDNDLNVEFFLTPWGQEQAESRKILSTPCDGKEVTWHYKEGDVELWDFEQPNLYNLTARLYRNDTLVDEKTIRIGFRTFTAEGNRFILNGRPINLTNDSWHYMGFAVQTEEYARSYYRMARDCNVNIVRLHAQPFPSFFFHIADEMGMLLVSESAVWASHCNFSYNSDFFENSKKHVERLVLRDRNHPSVVMWSVENECIPAYKVCGSKFIKDVADLEAKLYDMCTVVPPLDPSRLISCDGTGDLGGRLPVNSLHYPGYNCPTHREKPITIGEMGSMYYSTPDNVCMELGEKTLESFNGRLEAVGLDAFNNLIGQRKWAAQICVFNLIWYGLTPLPFEDRLLTYDDYTAPGIKPSRITPYLRTLNAGAQDNLPEYIPNPVWELTREAYIPVRFFAEKPPNAGWTGEELTFPVAIFNDNRDATALKLKVALKSKGKEIPVCKKEFSLEACTFVEETLAVTMPNVTGEWQICLALYANDKCVFSQELPVVLYERKAIEKEWATLGTFGVTCVSDEDGGTDPVIDCRISAPYEAFVRSGGITRIFGINSQIDFNQSINCKYFEPYLPFNAKPLYFNGVGNPIILSLVEAGQPRILCGIDLNQCDDPQAWLLRIELGKYIVANTVQAPKPAYFFGDADSNVAAMLNEIRAQYEPIAKEQLMALLNQPQDRLLIVDGTNNLEWLRGIGKPNFANVLVMNMDKVPDLFSYEFNVTDRKAYHLRGGECARDVGVYGNSLYGLGGSGDEPLSHAMLQYHQKNDAIIFGMCDIDWRMWNHNAEYLKTASIIKSEKADNSAYAALSCHKYAGSHIFFSQISLSTQNQKTKNLTVRLLSSLNCGIDLSENNELNELLFGGLYSNKVTSMLFKPLAADEKPESLNPGLNRIENDQVWGVIRSDKRSVSGALAIFVYTPQDRTDLLANPDTVDMTVKAEKDCYIYLNGELAGQGKEFMIPSVILHQGWNKLVVYCPEGQPLPDIRFKRMNLERLDLKFGLYDNDVMPQNLQLATLVSQDQPNGLENAISGREKHWRASDDQREGLDLGVVFSTPITAKGIYFSCATGHGGEIFTPYRFKILAGDSMDNLKKVFITKFEPLMHYREGQVFIRLDDVTASCFKIVLTDNALKPWIVSGLTVLS